MELETALKIIADQGWTPTQRKRRKGTLYLYAQRRNRLVPRQIEERYIGPVKKLDAMSKEEILTILERTKAS